MRLLESLINDYLTISKQLTYHIGKRNIVQADKYERDQKAAAMKLVTTLMGYHGITLDELATEEERLNRDA